MGRKSLNTNKSIFQLAREELGLSRAAATLIMDGDPNFHGMRGISENRLVKMENGTAPIYPGDVVEMAARYNKPELRNYYCCHECEIGKKDAPPVSMGGDVHKILVDMAVSLRNVNHSKVRLMEMLRDEEISEDEQYDFDEIYKELENISQMVEALQLWCERMKIAPKNK